MAPIGLEFGGARLRVSLPLETSARPQAGSRSITTVRTQAAAPNYLPLVVCADGGILASANRDDRHDGGGSCKGAWGGQREGVLEQGAMKREVLILLFLSRYPMDEISSCHNVASTPCMEPLFPPVASK